MGSIEQDLYDLAGRPESLVSYLDSLPFDVLAEIDVVNDTVADLFRVEGKFPGSSELGSFSSVYDTFCEHIVHPDDVAVYAALMDPATLLQRLEGSSITGILKAKFRVRMENDEWRWISQFVVGGTGKGLPAGVAHVYVFDIQNLKDRESGYTSSSLPRLTVGYDQTTGLLRLREFFSKVNSYLAENDCTGWCLLAMDIDQFKLFNEWNGREAGDAVLGRIGAYLSERANERGWLVGYLGQDDFCVLMPYDEDSIEDLYADIAGIVADNGRTMTFTPIFGVSMIGHAEPIMDVLDRAVLASGAAKDDFKHRIRLFEPSMYRQTDAEYRLLDDFQKALENHEITYYVQPQCRISNGKIVGVEALARWQKPDGSFVSPADFVPVLEKYGFISNLDKYIWEDVCIHLRAWLDSGHQTVPISVNVSKHDIYAFDIVEYFEMLTEKYDIPHSVIKIEITESAYADDADVVGETVRRLREAGFVILMDDFGSGYSSLNMLDNLRVDVIKLDMMFMRMSDEDKRKSIRIIESVVNMAKTMDLLVITEGVETNEQTEFLKSIGCRYVQGFHYYRPMSCEEFEDLIEDGELIDEQGFAFKSNDEFKIREFLDNNVYSDSMLNSILGAVAMYSWHGDDIDITRFNEQFYETVNIPELEERLTGIQNYVSNKDRHRLFELLDEAMRDELNGSTGVIRFINPDKTPSDFLMHYFYLGEESGAHKFYGSARDVTVLNELRDEMKLLSGVTDKSVVFLKKQDSSWHYRVEIHGLKEDLALSRRDFQAELEDGSFFDRIDAPESGMLKNLSLDSGEVDEHFTLSFGLTNAFGCHLDLRLRFFCVEDDASVFSYILVFQRVQPIV